MHFCYLHFESKIILISISNKFLMWHQMLFLTSTCNFSVLVLSVWPLTKLVFVCRLLRNWSKYSPRSWHTWPTCRSIVSLATESWNSLSRTTSLFNTCAASMRRTCRWPIPTEVRIYFLNVLFCTAILGVLVGRNSLPGYPTEIIPGFPDTQVPIIFSF